MPLENPNHPNIIGLRLALSLGKGHDSRYEFLASKVVESAAGEREYAEHVKIINITSLPEYPEENGYIEMKDLGKYIEWKFPIH